MKAATFVHHVFGICDQWKSRVFTLISLMWL